MSTTATRTRHLRTITSAAALGAVAALLVPAAATADPAPVPGSSELDGSVSGSVEDFPGSVTGSVQGFPGSVGNLLGNTGSALEVVDGLLDADPGQVLNGVLSGIAALDTTGSLAAHQPCNVVTVAGGPGTTNTVHELGRSGPGTVELRHETYDVPDRIQVFYEGNMIHDTGYIGDYANEGTGTAIIAVPAGQSTSILVRVTGPGGTEWEYTPSCMA